MSRLSGDADSAKTRGFGAPAPVASRAFGVMEVLVPATIATGPQNYAKAEIPVRRISAGDANAALREGWADFMEMRGDLIFIGLLYPLLGVAAAMVVVGSPLLPMLFPLVAGIGLLGPLAAVGFYEMARRREEGLHSNWSHF